MTPEMKKQREELCFENCWDDVSRGHFRDGFSACYQLISAQSHQCELVDAEMMILQAKCERYEEALEFTSRVLVDHFPGYEGTTIHKVINEALRKDG